MIFLYILLAVSVSGVFLIPLVHMMNPSSSIESSGEFSRDDLHRNLNNIKNLTLKKVKSIGQGLGRNLVIAYNEGLSKIRNTKISGLVQGKGILGEKATTSNFLKDVKEHRDKIREELANGVNNEEEKIVEIPEAENKTE